MNGIQLRKNHSKVVYALLVMALVMMYAVPAFATDRFYNFEFSFDGMGIRYTDTEWKSTRDAVTMNCTESENISPYAYYAKVCSTSGKSTSYYSFYTGRFHAFYDACGYVDTGVYISAYLGGDDTDVFRGIWNPDDSRY